MGLCRSSWNFIQENRVAKIDLERMFHFKFTENQSAKSMKHQDEFDFPRVVTKHLLREMYGVSCHQIKQFLPEELREEISWKTKRTFTPEETRKIFMALSPTRYQQFISSKLNLHLPDNDIDQAA